MTARIINRIRKLLGFCEHDFRLVRRSQSSFLRCRKCGAQSLKEGRK